MVSRRKITKKIKKSKKRRSRRNILDGGDDIIVIIRDFEGKKYTITVNTDDTVKQLIEKCKEQSPIDEKEFKYIISLTGKILSENENILDCGIAMESTLDLMIKKLLWEFKTVNYQQPGNLYTKLEPSESIEKHSKVSKEISDELNNGWEIANVFYRYHNGPSVFPEILYKKKYFPTEKYDVKFIDYNDTRKQYYKLTEFDEWAEMVKKSSCTKFTFGKRDIIDKETYINEVKKWIDNLDERTKSSIGVNGTGGLKLPDDSLGISDEINNGWEIVNIYYYYIPIYFNTMSQFPKILYKKKIS